MLHPPMELPYELTIKVKYGEFIKRLTASVTRNNLDLDIAKLRDKITLAFNLCPSAHFIMTYSDRDGDTVMLDDDEDLRDAAVNQKLNPLRINVQLRYQPNVAPNSAEPEPNTANRTRRTLFCNNLSMIGSSLAEVLRSPSHDKVPKMLSTFTERIKKNAQPVSQELLPKLSTLGKTQAARPSNVYSGSSSSPASGTKETTPITSSKETKPTPASEKKKEPKMVRGFDKEWFPFAKLAEDKAASDRQRKGKALMQNASLKDPFCAPKPVTKLYLRHGPHQDVNGNAYASSYPPIRIYRAGQPLKKGDVYVRTFPAGHCGVTCHGCNAKISFGSYYKSIVQYNHDVCFKCFTRFGKPDHYVKIISFPSPSRMDSSFNPDNLNSQIPRCVIPIGGPKMSSKLDSSFIQDVTIPNGTIIAPSTQFRKVWRMRNNGSMNWPFGTRLICVGGNQLTTTSFPLEIPVTGLPLDEEIDLAVDFSAPARAGRYTSHWRLATPSGQKFGQIVWVLFQVGQPDNSTRDINFTVSLDLSSRSSSYDSTDLETTDGEDTSDSEPSVKIKTSNDRSTLEDLDLSSESSSYYSTDSETTDVEDTSDSEPSVKIKTSYDRSTLEDLDLSSESSSYDSTDSETTDVEDTSDSEPSVKTKTSNDRSRLDETQVSDTESDTNSVNGSNNAIPSTVLDPPIDSSLTSETVADPGPSVPVLEVEEDNVDAQLKELDHEYLEVDLEVLGQLCEDDPCGFSDSEWDLLNENLEGTVENGRSCTKPQN